MLCLCNYHRYYNNCVVLITFTTAAYCIKITTIDTFIRMYILNKRSVSDEISEMTNIRRDARDVTLLIILLYYQPYLNKVMQSLTRTITTP